MLEKETMCRNVSLCGKNEHVYFNVVENRYMCKGCLGYQFRRGGDDPNMEKSTRCMDPLCNMPLVLSKGISVVGICTQRHLFLTAKEWGKKNCTVLHPCIHRKAATFGVKVCDSYNGTECLRTKLECLTNGSAVVVKIQNGDAVCATLASLKDKPTRAPSTDMSKEELENLRKDTTNNMLQLQSALPDDETAASYTPEQLAEVNEQVSKFVEDTFSDTKALNTESASIGLDITQSCLSNPDKIIDKEKKNQYWYLPPTLYQVHCQCRILRKAKTRTKRVAIHH